MKFTVLSEETNTVLFVITDTKSCWYEHLTNNSLTTRYRACNPTSADQLSADMERWRADKFQQLVAAHSVEAFQDADFSVLDSYDYDLVIQFIFDQPEEWTWRWNLTRMGPRTSANFLSKHLIVPLVLSSHVAFQTIDAKRPVSEQEWEKNVSTTANHAKRSLVHQLKGAFSKPRFVDAIRTIGSALSTIRPASKTHVISDALSSPKISDPVPPISTIPGRAVDNNLPTPSQQRDPPIRKSPTPPPASSQPMDEDASATETESDEDKPSQNTAAERQKPEESTEETRPPKRVKAKVDSSDEDEETRVADTSRKRAPAVRQPVRRGGKRW
ncbi:hypothetical protein SISNIDRAFT_458149 [Sistotremastrum niveocremeum HHB9708]|uniref:XLF-like N-terminal domain-containing protein n=1 Tax=Sistotremastrum niveocremeum HHB9708 TaxID=1314777 RepID=A0A164R2S7_9AGAM|nr:hypothetical protein SISNIDRAFT_458149 [Sistotremastrum niveocremeum HHB9708]